MAKFEWHIAWRYLFSKKGHNAINIVTGISSVAIIVVTAAMICVLSVLNGMGRLAEQLFTAFDPPLLVVPAEGQTLRTDTLPIASLYAREDIETISRQIEQTCVVRFDEMQAPARVLGVDSLFQRTAGIDSIIYDGKFMVFDGAHERAVIGNELSVAFHTTAFSNKLLHLYAPKRTKRINLSIPLRHCGLYRRRASKSQISKHKSRIRQVTDTVSWTGMSRKRSISGSSASRNC